ncbi:MAG: glycosyltransferase family 39 protein, partial [bacterium]
MKTAISSGIPRTIKNYSTPKGLAAYLSNLRVIFGVALIVRLIFVAFLKEGFYFSDFRAYDTAALHLLAGEGFVEDYARPPLYPLFLAANYWLLGTYMLPVRIVQCALGALFSVLLFLLTKRLLSENSARIAAWISVFYPYSVFVSGLLYPTLLTAFLLLCVVFWLTTAYQKHSWGLAACAAVALGLASLATPVSLAFLPFVVLWFLFFSGWKLRRSLFYSLICVSFVAATLTPWLYHSYQQYGHFVLIDGRAAKHLPSLDAASPLGDESSNLGAGVWRTIKTQPGAFIGNMAKEFIHFWAFVPDRVVTDKIAYRQKVHQVDQRMIVSHPFTSSGLRWVSILSYGPVFFLAILGLYYGFKHWRLLSLPFLLLMSHALGYSLFFTQVRYRLPVEFCLMILAAKGGEALLHKLTAKSYHLGEN